MGQEQGHKTFHFELVSPERRLMALEAWQVTIPGFEGDFGVRAGHSALVSSLRAGVIEVRESPALPPRKIKVSGGFADVTQAQCTVLAEEAQTVSD